MELQRLTALERRMTKDIAERTREGHKFGPYYGTEKGGYSPHPERLKRLRTEIRRLKAELGG